MVEVPQLRFPEHDDAWVTSRIKQAAEVITGSTPPTSDRKNYGDKYLFVSPADIGKTRYIRETKTCLLYTSPSPRDKGQSRMPSSA